MTTRKAANGEKAKEELLKTFSAADVERVIVAPLDLGQDSKTLLASGVPLDQNRAETRILSKVQPILSITLLCG